MPKKSDADCIYLDHHATTPMDERVFLAMKPFFCSKFGNANSTTHAYGWQAADVVEEARKLVASAINAHPTEIVFTSGATESTNMALKGLFFPKPTMAKRHVVSSTIEHSATLSTLAALEAAGVRVSLIKPSQEGLIQEAALKHSLTPDTALVSLFLVHNEVGSINHIQNLARIAHEHGALFHCDAAQALGKIAIDCQDLDIDMMSLSGHKAYGPKGMGCLYIRRRVMEHICPLIHGGGQEWHKRSGTLNVPGIVGMGEACRLAAAGVSLESKRIRHLRDRLVQHVMVLEGVHINGSMEERVCGNLHVSFDGIDGEELVLGICHRVAVSTGSACSARAGGSSHVLQELGIPASLRQASLRFGLGRFTTEAEIDEAAELIVEQVKRLRRSQPTPKKLIKLTKDS